MMARQFGSDARVAWSDSLAQLDLQSPELTFDAMHLTPQGNAIVAAALVDPILRTVKAAGL